MALGEQPRGAVHVELLLGLAPSSRERSPIAARNSRSRGRARGRRAARAASASRAPRRRGALEEGGGPVDEPGVDRLGEGEDALGDLAVGGDRDDGDDPRLQQQHLDPVDRRGAHRRRRDERQQVVGLGERCGRLAQRVLDLAAHLRERRRGPAGPAWRDARPQARHEQRVGVEAVAGVGRHAARRRCAGGSGSPRARARRARCAPSRHPTSTSRASAIAFEPTGVPRLQVRLDGEAEDPLLAFAEHAADCRKAPGRRRGLSRSCPRSRSSSASATAIITVAPKANSQRRRNAYISPGIRARMPTMPAATESAVWPARRTWSRRSSRRRVAARPRR